MRITMIDDGIPYDGAAPDARPLGGAEKAFARLAAALAARGHEVSAINQCYAQTIIDGVPWLPFESPRPPETDVLLAFRKPALLDAVDDAKHRCLWMWDAASALAGEAARAALMRHQPTLVFTGPAHARGLKTEAVKSRIVVPGVAEVYRTVPANDSPAPVAIVTTHPLHGLLPIVRLWRERIHPRRPIAELHIYSAVLRKALDEDACDDKLKDVFDAVRAGRADGITVRAPQADPAMAEAYGRARVHLYPVVAREMYASTLAESQAAGLPAIVRATGGASAQLLERVRNGMSGYFAPDDEAFINLSLAMLDSDRAVYRNLAAEARALQRTRGWADAAIEFEAMWV